MEYIKYIQDLEGVSRPVKDVEAEELVNSLSQEVADVQSAINSAQSAINSAQSDIDSIKSDISNIKTGGAVEKLGTQTVGSASQPIYLDQGSPKAGNTTVPLAGGVTMTGTLAGPAGTDYTTTKFRNIVIATSLPSASGHNGDLCVIIEG